MQGRIIGILLLLLFPVFCIGQRTEHLIVYFKFNKYFLDDASKKKIDSVLQHPLIEEINIAAHCDSIGSNSYNDALSLKRAMAVKDYLLSRKLNDSLIH